VLVAVIAWTAVVNPKLSDASSLRSQIDSARTDNLTLQVKIGKLQRDSANLGALAKSLAIAHAALPSDTGLAAFTRQLGAEAAATHVTVTSITASTPAPATGPGVGAPAAPAAAAAGTSAPAAPAAGPASTSTPGTQPAAGAAGALYAIPLTIAVTGAQADALRFLRAVQTQGPRAVLVTSTQLSGQAAGAGSSSTLTIQLQVFSAPRPATPTPTAAANR
jgi:Tfp pilus assembly protein PilO